jgi:hypothetical protein
MKMFQININKYFLLILSSIIIFISLPQKISSQKIQNNTLESILNKCLNEYNKTNIKLDEITPKLKTIKFNIILKVYFSQLKNINKRLKYDISKMEKYLNEKNDKKFFETNNCDEYYEKFENKYNKTIKIYYKFEKLKNGLSKFFKIFFISIFIGIAIFSIFVLIISIIVIKKQKKYYILQEEVTIEDGKEVEIKNKLDNKPKFISDIRSEKDRMLGSTVRSINQNLKNLLKKFPKKNNLK